MGSRSQSRASSPALEQERQQALACSRDIGRASAPQDLQDQSVQYPQWTAAIVSCKVLEQLTTIQQQQLGCCTLTKRHRQLLSPAMCAKHMMPPSGKHHMASTQGECLCKAKRPQRSTFCRGPVGGSNRCTPCCQGSNLVVALMASWPQEI